ncbi:MAG: RHS repeat-associated core domain-containing protein [Pseudomonadota bacterium]
MAVLPPPSACFGAPDGIAFDAQDNLYIADAAFNAVRKITASGIISTVAGTGTAGFSGDGGLATSAALSSPNGVAADTQGNLYIADSFNKRVRKVSATGIITTVVGGGGSGSYTATEPASQVRLNFPVAVTVDAEGSLYISDFGSKVVRKVTTDGVIRTLAGKYSYYVPIDGGAATLSGMNPHGIAVNAKGDVYIADADDSSSNQGGSGNNRIRKVGADGIIATVVGNGTRGFFGDGGLATAATISSPTTIAFDAQGNLYFSDQNNDRVRKVTPFLPGVGLADIAIPAADGSELYVFNASGRHLRTLNAFTGAMQYSFNYDANGYLIQITDGDGNMTRIERDGVGIVGAIVAADGQRTTLSLDSNGYLKSIKSAANESTQMEYDAGGLLVKFTNPRSFSSTMTYNTGGRLIQDKNAGGGSWDLVRTNAHGNRYQVNMTTALGRTTRFDTEVLSVGDVRRIVTQADASLSSLVQKADGTVISTAADGTVATTNIGSDSRFGMQVPIASTNVIKFPSGLTSRITNTRTATLNNPQDLQSLISSVNTTVINDKEFKTTYDANLKQLTVLSPLNRKNIATIDSQGRLTKMETAGFSPHNYSYDTRGRLQSVSQGSGADLRESSYTYNAAGLPATFTDALQRTTAYSYDEVGRIKTVTLPGQLPISVDYDANGNPILVTPPGRPQHGFGYNNNDLADTYTPPATGIALTSTKFTYNLDKQPLSVTRPDGLTLNYLYDDFGRLRSKIAPTGSTIYAYEPSTARLASITAPGEIVLDYSYDGALPTEVHLNGPVVGTLNIGYDNFLRTSVIGVNGDSISYQYDDDGMLSNAGALNLVRDTATGALKGSNLGQIGTSQTYDSYAQLHSFTAKYGSVVIFDEAYALDKIGRMAEKTVTIAGNSNIYKYAYDPAGRLANVTKDGSTIGTFTYDDNGNRVLAYGISAVYDAQDRLTNLGDAIYSYSDNGELKAITAGDQITGFDYDVFGNLQRIDLPDGTKVNYLVDGLNRRIGKKVNGNLVQGFLYQDLLKVAAELDGNGNIVSRFVYGGKPNVPEYLVRNGITYRIITDQLGSVRMVVNSVSGQLVQRIDYDEWGNVQMDTNPGFQPFGFAGGLYDRDSGLVRFGRRDYDPRIGRWTVKDPIGFGGGSTSLYAYVGSNPLNAIDPFGLASLNLFNPYATGKDHDVINYAGANKWNIPGAYTVAGHGNPGNMEDGRNGGHDPLWPADLAKIIENDKENWFGQTIVLGACNTGNSWPSGFQNKNWIPFGQSLANLLGVRVIAPNGFSWYSPTGGMIGSAGPDKGPAKGTTGNWTTFLPQNK